MSGKSMHITMKICSEAEIGWLFKHQPGHGKKECFIDLKGDTTRDEVDTLLRVLAGYNRSYLDEGAPKEKFLHQMHHRLDKRDLTLPGGIHFAGDGQQIYPGCCCGVEQWADISAGLKRHRPPWMGHGPDVSFLEKDGICYIADVELESCSAGKIIRDKYGRHGKVGIEDAIRDEKIKIIHWQEQEFQDLLDRLDKEFEDFLNGPLQERLKQLAGGWARQFVRAFDRCFRRHEKIDKDSITLIV